MNIVIYFEAAIPRKEVMLHIWGTQGKSWDIPGVIVRENLFRFDFECETESPSELRFKYCFPHSDNLWEPDIYNRRIPPVKDVKEIWSFDFTSRCMTENPYKEHDYRNITFQVHTLKKFRGGEVFAWNPDGEERGYFTEVERDDETRTSTFAVQLEDWMHDGFYFKLKNRDYYEPDRLNRVWKPGDGDNVWMKSGHLCLYKEEIKTKKTKIELIYTNTIPDAPSLYVVDDVDDFEMEVYNDQHEEHDELYNRCRFDFDVYPGQWYYVTVESPHVGDTYRMAFVVDRNDGKEPRFIVYGDNEWHSKLPKRTKKVRVVIHPNPKTGFGEEILFHYRPGKAPQKREAALVPPSETVTAKKCDDGTWKAEFKVFPGVEHWIDKLFNMHGALESRPDGIFLSGRTFRAKGRGIYEFHTADGLSGCIEKGAPLFAGVSTLTRTKLMAAVYGKDIARSGIFEFHEMPHGAVYMDGEAWFTLYAPHAVEVKLLILDRKKSTKKKRFVREYVMKSTNDLRYWWVKLPRSEAPPGTEYRFQLNDNSEVLDPASKRVIETGRLWALPGDGIDEAWSITVDMAEIHACFGKESRATKPFEEFIIYEMHPLRITRRHKDKSGKPLPAFRQMEKELEEGGYLNRLPVTALELMPVHEFPKEISWGYNPSLFFAIESFYGGPLDFASMVNTAHKAGKMVMVDAVFNHIIESPLHAIATDVYISGETLWGDMVNYGHPLTLEFFRQALLYLWYAFRLDGFRFDCTKAMLWGGYEVDVLKKKIIGRYEKILVGSKGGREFLANLRSSLRQAAEICGTNWPYLVGESIPNDWDMTNPDFGVLDGQWDVTMEGPLAEAARNQDDKTGDILGAMANNRPYQENVVYGESHDSVSGQSAKNQRIVMREPWGNGMSMAKAVGTTVLMARGVPMLFMGQEAGEYIPFYFLFDLENPTHYLRLKDYQNENTDNNKVLNWFTDLMGLRNNPWNGIRGEDNLSFGRGHKTLAFSRSNGRFFTIVTFGTNDQWQNLGYLNLPEAEYKEIFNSTWNRYRTGNEHETSNGRYEARLNRGSNINLPSIGGIILERR